MKGTIVSLRPVDSPRYDARGRLVVERHLTVTVMLPLGSGPSGVELTGREVELYLSDPGCPACRGGDADCWRCRPAGAAANEGG